MYEHNALGYWSGLALCLTKVRSSRARCPATALIYSSMSSHKSQRRLYYTRFIRFISARAKTFNGQVNTD